MTTNHFVKPLVSATMLIALVLSGCTDLCTPQNVPTEVSLGLRSEEVRTLPILSSGETRIAGEEVPDSHGRMELEVNVTHPGSTNATLNFNDVAITGLQIHVTIEGRLVPVEIIRVQGSNPWSNDGGGRWNGAAVSGSRIVVWWAVDVDPAKAPLAIALPEGAPYRATIEFDWSHRDCYALASGRASASFEDSVQASVNARTFAPVGTPAIEAAPGGVGLRADFQITSGLNVTISKVEARAVRFAAGMAQAGGNASVTGPALNATGQAQVTLLLPKVGLVAFPKLATLVDGNASAEVSPGDGLRVQSAAAASQAYATSGTMLPAAFGDEPAVYVLFVSISYVAQDPTIGSSTDTFAYAIARP